MADPVVVIVHGTKGTPEGNWFAWLDRELTARGVKVLRPRFPTPEGQTLANWREVFRQGMDDLAAARGREEVSKADVILVGHSLGAAFVLRLAEDAGRGSAVPYRAVIGVCPFAEALGLEAFDPFNHDFVAPAWDWGAVRNGARDFLFYAGNDDPFVPLAVARRVRDAVGCGDFEVVDKGKHLTDHAGFTEFPPILKRVLGFLGREI